MTINTKGGRLPEPTRAFSDSKEKATYLNELVRSLNATIEELRLNIQDNSIHTIEALEEGVSVGTEFTTLNFLGTPIAATDSGGGTLNVTVTPGVAPVDSVNGLTGVVVLDSDDIAEGATNLYWNATLQADLDGKLNLDTSNDPLTGGLTVANAANALNSGDYPLYSQSGVTDSATAIGYTRDTVNKLDTLGSIVDSLKTGGAPIYTVEYEVGTGLFGSPSIIFDFNGESAIGRIVRFYAGGVLGSFSFMNYNGTDGIGIFPSSSAFASPAAGTALDSATINFGYANGAQYWAGFTRNGVITAFSPANSSGAMTALGHDTIPASRNGKWQGIHLQEDTGVYLGNSTDAHFYHDGTNVILNPKLVGSGYFEVQGMVKTTETFIASTSTTALAAYTITTEHTLSCTATCTVSLPASPKTGQIHNIRHNVSTAATVTVSGNGNNINGATTQLISFRYDVIKVQFDGTEWMII